MPGTIGAGPAPPAWSARRVRMWRAAAVALGLTLRLLFASVYWVDKPLTLDEQEYLLLARNVACGLGFNYPAVAGEGAAVVHFERPPVYPALLAGALVATGHPWTSPAACAMSRVPLPRSSSEIPRVVAGLQSVMGALGVWFIGAIARKAAGPRAAVLAAFVAALEPPLVWICGFALNEAVYSLLALVVAWLLMRASGGRPSWRLGLVAGCVAGVAVLTKEGMLLFVPLAGLWLLATRQARVACAAALGLALVLVPWVGRNYAVHGRFVLTAAHGGVTFWTGNNPLARGEGDLAANTDLKRARNELEARHAGASAQEMDAVYYGEAFAFIRRQPAAWLALEARKLFYTIVPVGPSYMLHSVRYRLGSWLAWAFLLPCAAIGIVRLRRRRLLATIWPVPMLAASVVLMNLVFFPQERFRIPVIEPALIICAAACVAPRGARSLAPDSNASGLSEAT
jgi:hypothetical protein